MEVRKDDLWLLLICTVRYAMGRRSYITSAAPDLVKMYKSALRPDQIAQIGEEVRKELAFAEGLGHKLGMDMDHRGWQQFAEWCEEEVGAAKTRDATDPLPRADGAAAARPRGRKTSRKPRP